MEDKKLTADNTELSLNSDLSLEEFSISELEDRLEFITKCTINVKPS